MREEKNQGIAQKEWQSLCNSNYFYKTEPWLHQRKALDFLMQRNYAALFTKPGSGKTKIMVDLIVNKDFQRTLVIAPKKPAESVWDNEIYTHSFLHSENVLNLTGFTMQLKLSLLEDYRDFNDILIIISNYDVMHDKRLIAALEKIKLDCIICDESHRIKAPNGKISKAIAKLGKKVKHRYIMSGTPFSDKPTDIFGQYRFLDTNIFGRSYQKFFDEYTNIDPVFSAKVGHPILKKSDPYRNQKQLAAIVEQHAFTMEPILKLPEAEWHIHKFKLGEYMSFVYQSFEKEGFLKINGTNEAFISQNVLSKKQMLQRIVNGYAYAENDKGKRQLYHLHNQRKLALQEILYQLELWAKVVVFYKYSTDKKSIYQVCKKLGRTCGEISGQQNDLQLWQDEEINTIAVQYAAGAEGLTLVESSICIFYSLPYSLSQFEQAVARQRRPGQLSPKVDYYFIIGETKTGQTVDQEILDCLKNKKSYIEEIRLQEGCGIDD